LAHELAQLEGLAAHLAAHLLPRRRLLGVSLLDEGSTLVGEREQLAPVALLRADQSLVLELLEGRVDRDGTRAPHAVAALLHLLHDLVAVARLLREQQQGRRADVAAARLAPATTRAAPGAEPTEAAEAASRAVAEAVMPVAGPTAS